MYTYFLTVNVMFTFIYTVPLHDHVRLFAQHEWSHPVELHTTNLHIFFLVRRIQPIQRFQSIQPIQPKW